MLARTLCSLPARSAAGIALTAVLVGGLPAAAGAAEVTNPADKPAPVSVTIDGQTYADGLDTLPGYDDYLCTPIPNVQYDFANNEIQYYDNKNDLIETARWTEWERISSYATWVTQQKNKDKDKATPTPAPSSSSNAGGGSNNAPAPSAPSNSGSTAGGTTNKPSTTTATKDSSKSDSKKDDKSDKKDDKKDDKSGDAAEVVAGAGVVAGAAAGGGGGNTPSGGGKVGADEAAAADKEPSADEQIAASTAESSLAEPTGAAAATKPLSDAVTSGAGQGAGNTRTVGAGILLALLLGGLALVGAKFARRQVVGHGGGVTEAYS